MRFRRHRHHTERAVAALADGSLPREQREEVERALAASPELQADLAVQRQVVEAIRTAAGPAPAALRVRVDSVHPTPVRRRRLSPAGVSVAATAAAAVLAAVAVVLFSGGGSGTPTLTQAAAASHRPAQQSVAAPSPGQTTLPGVFVDGLPYPSWSGSFGYRATGVRRDTIGDRELTTVYYEHPARADVAYTIVSGAPLNLPGQWRSVTRGGVVFWIGRIGDHAVVTWERDGHTCIVTASSHALPALLRLATWRQGGEIPY